MRDILGSSSGGVLVIFSSSVIFGGSVWVRAWAASSKGRDCFIGSGLVPSRSAGMNQIKHGENVKGRPVVRVLAR